ncbi:MAG: ribonuclease E/G, partial [Vallitaleaceae bacterium]|nr:ribonuclease E/G [Vallitaleaceae bacterium]
DEHTKELKRFLIQKANGYGLIVRTNAYMSDLASIEREFEFLLKHYQEIMHSKDFRKPRTLLYEGEAKWLQSVQNMNKDGLEAIEVDDEEIHSLLLEYLTKNHLEHIPLQYNRKVSLYQKYDFNKTFKHISFRKVYLSSGASIIIDKTEAMYVIDVNSDKNQSASKKNILKINLEAAKQIAREIRLRNLSGIIIIDFIDLIAVEDQELLLKTLDKLFSEDPIQTVVHGMTRLGLVEITRKRIEPALDIQLGL